MIYFYFFIKVNIILRKIDISIHMYIKLHVLTIHHCRAKSIEAIGMKFGQFHFMI